MKKTLQLTFILVLTVFAGMNIAQAQLPTTHAIGARFGSATGVTYRYSLNQTNAIEGILSVQSNSKYSRFRLVGLYEYHMPIANDFSWFWGFGGSVGSYAGKAYTDDKGNRFDKYSELALSVDGIAGVEYKIPSAPIALSLDIKPHFDFLQSSGFKIFDTFGFSVRYTF
ncbi:hypothetical protein [Sphingobacterium hotanense]|uniref:hypothetical protein n=1 Tax=Sphingobacterium hotanense TaxID=649196 RepID=UPI0021A66DB9|nr:hypothetical protein [Sphingobacterium hotanense]MCT1526590.1 hypothetical protein [Sphingobacterium hotanense]